ADKDKPVSVKEASEKYSDYRARRAAEILQGIIDERTAETEEGQPEEPPQPSAEELAKQQQAATEESERQAAAQRQFEHEQQRMAELEGIRQQANQYSLALSTFVQGLNQRAMQEFPDVKTLQQAEHLRQTDPVRFAKLNQILVDEQGVRGELGRIQQ